MLFFFFHRSLVLFLLSKSLMRPCTTKSIRNRSLLERRPRTHEKNPAMQEQVIVQEIPQASQVVDSFLSLRRLYSRYRFHRRHSIRAPRRPAAVLAATHAATALATTDDDPTTPILDDEQMLFRYQAQIDQCVHMLKTKKEDLARNEEETAAILERALRAASRNRRECQKVVDENNALILHHRQSVQTTKEKLAFLMREMQENREHAAAQNTSSASRRKPEAQTLTSLLMSDFVQHMILHFLRREGDCSECSTALRFHRFGLSRRARYDCQE